VKDSRAAIEIKGDQNRLNIYGSDVTLTDMGQDNIVESCPNSRVSIVRINSPQNILNVPGKARGLLLLAADFLIESSLLFLLSHTENV
jgi:hypothetical protein